MQNTIDIGEGDWIKVDWHPDKTAEAVRRQICEAEIVQAIGRGRGINQADLAMPPPVDERRRWRAVNALIVMVIREGILLLSATDLVRARRKEWALRTAKRALQELGAVTSRVREWLETICLAHDQHT